jgi:hypothetical protein
MEHSLIENFIDESKQSLRLGGGMNLIKLYHVVKQAQAAGKLHSSEWHMNEATLLELHRQLKLVSDPHKNPSRMVILNIPVYIVDAMPDGEYSLVSMESAN